MRGGLPGRGGFQNGMPGQQPNFRGGYNKYNNFGEKDFVDVSEDDRFNLYIENF